VTQQRGKVARNVATLVDAPALPAAQRATKQLLIELRAHRDEQETERVGSEGYWTDHGLVFPNELGGPMDDRNDYRAWVRLLRTAKVRRIRLHDGRHTAATLLLVRRVASDATLGSIRQVV
jgi:integrase